MTHEYFLTEYWSIWVRDSLGKHGADFDALMENGLICREPTRDVREKMHSTVQYFPMLNGVFRIKGTVGCSEVYVLEEGRTVIDTGNMFGLVDELQALGILDRIERILLTHAHFDHVGGVQEIYQLVNPDLFVHPLFLDHVRLLPDPFAEFFDMLAADGKLLVPKDGEILHGSGELKVFYTPGHTGADLSLWEGESGSLFSGDTVFVSRNSQESFWQLPDPYLGGSLQRHAETLMELLRLPVRHVFPGHGQPVVEKGMDQLKLTLLKVYRKLYPDSPEQAWLKIAEDLNELGLFSEAGQCAARASMAAAGRGSDP